MSLVEYKDLLQKRKLSIYNLLLPLYYKLRKTHGEIRDIDENAIELFRANKKKMGKYNKYTVFNDDETGLFCN